LQSRPLPWQRLWVKEKELLEMRKQLKQLLALLALCNSVAFASTWECGDLNSDSAQFKSIDHKVNVNFFEAAPLNLMTVDKRPTKNELQHIEALASGFNCTFNNIATVAPIADIRSLVKSYKANVNVLFAKLLTQKITYGEFNQQMEIERVQYNKELQSIIRIDQAQRIAADRAAQAAEQDRLIQQLQIQQLQDSRSQQEGQLMMRMGSQFLDQNQAPPKPLNCTSFREGATVRTVCN